MTDIQFGDVEFQGPDKAQRPDEDAHFAIVDCGEIKSDDLPIYVDLDVMRDMEAHARTNTDVELGGVMLGGQYVDADGNPFVVVSDSLRAEHFEATRGSFKFTHETWEQITRRRDDFSADLQMVGWYHTHPDWGVFLSGMDLFICDHFFNRPLDVALVIDPCRDDRGWFQWNGEQPPKVRETSGFFLMTNRFREDELNFYKTIYSGEGIMPNDPRYTGAGGSFVQPVVNINDQRTPVQNIAIMGMLTIQLLVLALIGYKLLADDQQETADKVDSMETRLALMGQAEQMRAREQAYGQAIAALSGGSDESAALVAKLMEAEEQKEKLRLNLDGQMALASEAAQQRDLARNANRLAEERILSLDSSLKNSQERINELLEYKQGAEKKLAGEPTGISNWIIYTGAAIVVVLALAGGFWLGGRDFGKYNRERHFGQSDDREPEEDIDLSEPDMEIE